MRLIKWIAGIVLSLIVFVVVVAVGLGWWFSSPISDQGMAVIQASKQYQDGKFVNIKPQSPIELSRSQLIDGLSSHPRTSPEGVIPVVSIDAERFEKPPELGMRLAWIGHATVLVEIDGHRILTDPVFSQRVSPVSFVGPSRFHPTPIPLEKLKGIDAVVVSHNHYDHLDQATVQHLSAQGTIFYVPLGNKSMLKYWGVPENQLKELDWWEEVKLGELRIISTPTRHYSNRGMFDYKKTLWSSWTVVGPNNRFFFSGDTGYSKVFTEIGNRFGPFDATLIKIGAYGPGASWLDVHMTPQEAMQVHKDLRGKVMLPVHWGTFNLAYHPWDEPIIQSVDAAKEAGVSLVTPKVGEFVDPTQQVKFSKWWEAVE